MAVFIINLDAKPASEEELQKYYETATEKINSLLRKYNIFNAKGECEVVTADNLKSRILPENFFGPTPLKPIFFDQKRSFIPQEIIDAFQSIVSNSPVHIKKFFFQSLMNLFKEKQIETSLSRYFETEYGAASNSVIILHDLRDCSVKFGVYKLTCRIQTRPREIIVLYIKQTMDLIANHEQVYYHLQSKLLPTARYAKMPYIVCDSENRPVLLLSPQVSGLTSNTLLSLLTYYNRSIAKADRETINKAIEMVIAAFINHAVLGDLLGRNDRHLLNSIIAPVKEGTLQQNDLCEFTTANDVVAFSQHIILNPKQSLSLIDIDIKWLLGEKNYEWALVDIDFGLSELNLLSLLPAFNDYGQQAKSFEKRKEYIKHYFDMYCEYLNDTLSQKEVLFSAIETFYPPHVSASKLQLLNLRIITFEKDKEPIIEMFKRYLLNYRIRIVYKEILIALYKFATESKCENLLNSLNQLDLMKYLSSEAVKSYCEDDVSLCLQCFRGVLNEKDMLVVAEHKRVMWENVANDIIQLTARYNMQLYNALEEKIQFIKQDAQALLNYLQSIIKKPNEEETNINPYAASMP